MVSSTLHEACSCKDSAAILRLLETNNSDNPSAANDDAYQTDDHGATPLHLLCCLNTSLPPEKTALKALVAANHMAVSDKDSSDDTPLHLLCRRADCLDRETVGILVEANPQALCIVDKNGYVPLHVACECPTINREVLALLIKTNPYALLHHAKIGDCEAMEESTSDIHNSVNASFDAHPRPDHELFNHRDGAYPLHIAISHGAPFNIIEMLTSNGPEVLELSNKFGQTPLCVAVLYKAKSDIVRFLVRCYPEALRIFDKKPPRLVQVPT